MVALLAEGVDRNFIVCVVYQSVSFVALLAEGVDRNSVNALPFRAYAMSPSSRRAWIEISFGLHILLSGFVALLAEGVDRNLFVDLQLFFREWVALLAEGVDRNSISRWRNKLKKRSPSSRRAWIEINLSYRTDNPRKSPSSRRAWIEIGIAL